MQLNASCWLDAAVRLDGGYFLPSKKIQNRLFKTRFSVGLNRRTFWESRWRVRSKYFVNFCEKGSKKRVLTAYHMRRLFRRDANRQRRFGNVNDLWIFSKGLLKIAFPWPMQWGDFFRWDTAQNEKFCRIKYKELLKGVKYLLSWIKKFAEKGVKNGF